MMSPGNTEASTTLIRLVQNSALTKMRQFSGKPGVELGHAPPNALGLSFWVAMILVAGEGLVITFKTHFASKQASAFIPEMQKDSTAAPDFIKEFCNLTAGAVKIGLGQNKIKTGISLPILARGFDEIVGARRGLRDNLGCTWALKLDSSTVLNSVEINLNRAIQLNDQLITEGSGEIEYL
jgi:hypothetical protein